MNRLKLREDENCAVPCVPSRKKHCQSEARKLVGCLDDYQRDLFREFQAAGDFSGEMVDMGLIQCCFLDVIQVNILTVNCVLTTQVNRFTRGGF